MKNTEIVSIIIPTYDNPQFLIPCIESLLLHKASESILKVYVVDNGSRNRVKSYLPKKLLNDIVLIEADKNLGWEGGLKLGLSKIPKDVEFVMFLNDDTYIPYSSKFWLNKMLQYFINPKVGAVGPSSNVVMALQNIFNASANHVLSVKLLIGFCMLLRRSALEKVGGVDDTLPGGDDFDLSIRLVDNGYKLVIDRGVFVFHHGFKTGERLRGGANVNGGWNSFEYMEKVNTALIKKHGFKRWQELMLSIGHIEPYEGIDLAPDSEGNIIREFLGNNKGKIYELGCGGQLTIENSIGVDMIPLNEYIGTIRVKSKATIVANVEDKLPFNDADVLIARHILEHMTDPLQTLTHWYNALKNGGKLIIAVPDEDLGLTIPMNVEHKHAYTKKFLGSLMMIAGFKNIYHTDSKNAVSFIITGEKI
jgi:GT2 family glycosyltransferase